jgi:serine/threonine protein kinase
LTNLSAGDRLGPYEILVSLGAGGMGEVYKARDTRLGRIVAIKTLKGPDDERFQREARAIASLNHPHVCTLHDIGDDYLVMEYVEGEPLCGPLPPAEASRYALQIAEVLEAARGITHRDLKPANILLTASGVKLLDFGLATVPPAADEDTPARLTEAGMIVGTVAYMSPEQAEGKPVDHRSDIFSFGAVLYELLTGKRPFHRDTAVASVAAILRDAPAPLPPEVPSSLRAVVERCLEKERSRRFASATELLAALLEAEPVSGPSRLPCCPSRT